MAAGTPTEAEIRTQWKNLVDVFEKHRVYADATVAGAGELDVLEQSLEGQFTHPALSDVASQIRLQLETVINIDTLQAGLLPILFEYSNIIDNAASDVGGAYTDVPRLLRAWYDFFANAGTPITVESRAITYDTSATTSDGTGGAIVGNGAITRLTVDERGYNIENCTVETKRFRCRRDQNSGTKENAEEFEVLGQVASQDSLLRQDSATTPSFGSGLTGQLIRSRHAGAGTQSGGSLLQNSSFSDFTDGATQQFDGWDEEGTNSLIGQDLVNFYRSFPNASVDASCEFTGSGGGTLTLKQTLENMTTNSLDPNRPYFFRVMVNADDGTLAAAGGTVTIKMGSQGATGSASETVANLLTNGWVELFIAADTNTWFRNFNEDPFDVEITWAGGTAGQLLIDDVIFAPYDLIDGTWWTMRGNAASHTPWLLDDTLTFTDTGGLPSTGKLQYYLFAGLGFYLPNSGTPVITDP